MSVNEIKEALGTVGESKLGSSAVLEQRLSVSVWWDTRKEYESEGNQSDSEEGRMQQCCPKRKRTEKKVESKMQRRPLHFRLKMQLQHCILHCEMQLQHCILQCKMQLQHCNLLQIAIKMQLTILQFTANCNENAIDDNAIYCNLQ